MARRAAKLELTSAALHDAAARIIGKRAALRDSFGIAVSGGPDSMALLVLATESFPGRVKAATVDHRLRPESAAEAKWVADFCTAHGVAHSILVPSEPITGSVQAAARTARYRLLEQWRQQSSLDWLMTAHHADDQLETLVMRLNRASGLGGLSGIRERQGHLLRPLLGFRRDTLQAVVTARGIPSIDDPSNRDPRFDRARVRAMLTGSDLIDAEAAATSVRHLAQEEEALDWVTRQLSAERLLHRDGICTVDVGALPPALRRRLLIVALAHMGESEPRADALDRAIADVQNAISSMLGNSILSADGAVWTIRPAPPRRPSTARSY